MPNASPETIFIAADHAGFILKNQLIDFLKSKSFIVNDLGTNSKESVDYPLYAHMLSKEILENKARGILICGSGIGMDISANRHRGIRAALCHNTEIAQLSRKHNNSNVLVLGARFCNEALAKEILESWLNTEFDGGRHERRVELIEKN
jgi:ribose 5-phosphate isomerase B